MPKSDELAAKLKESDPQIQAYVVSLETENAKLQRQIGKLEAENVSADNRIAALQEQIDKAPEPVQVQLQNFGHQLTLTELQEQAATLGYKLTPIS